MTKRSRAAVAVLLALAAAGVAAARPDAAEASFGIVPSPNPGGDAVLNGVAATSARNVWAVGERTGTGTLALRWDGSRWRTAVTPLSARMFAALYDVSATSASDVWAVGQTDVDSALILHNGGRGWSRSDAALAPGGTNVLEGVDALARDDAWAVGTVRDFSTASSRTLVEHWNGRRWSVVSSPDPSDDANGVIANELTAVDARAADDVWAVGFFYDSTANVDRPLVLHWNGSSWSVVPAPGELDLAGVSAHASDDVWAVGSDGSQAGAALHWDGSAWTAVATPTLSGCPTDVPLNDVVASSAASVWAVGTCSPLSGDQGARSGRTVVEHWDGAAWTRVPSISPSASGANELRALAQVPRSSKLWAVGASGANGLGAAAHTLAEVQP